jgi:hypothetical protein
MRTITKVDAKSSSIQLVVVHVANRRECRLRIFKLDKGKTARLSRLDIRHHANIQDASEFRKGLMELLFRRVEGKVTDKDIVLGGVGRGRTCASASTTTTACLTVVARLWSCWTSPHYCLLVVVVTVAAKGQDSSQCIGSRSWSKWTEDAAHHPRGDMRYPCRLGHHAVLELV